MKKVIGIDLGTTSISGVVFDVEGRKLIEKETIPGGHFLKTEVSWEKIQDAEEIIQKAVGMIDTFLEKHGDVKAIGIDCQMHGILYLGKNGNPVSPLFTWQDGRGEVKDAEGISIVEEILEKTGDKLASGYGMVTHLFQKKYHRVPEDAVSVGTIGDFLGMYLTGRTRPLMHTSNAASLGFFNSREGYFEKEKLIQMGADPAILPEVTSEVCKIGIYRACDVYIAIGDNQASFLGAAGMNSEKLLINIGTGSQVSILTDNYIRIPGMDTRPFVTGKWLIVGASLCGGRAYALLEHFFSDYIRMERKLHGAEQTLAEEQYPVMEKLAEEAMEKQHEERMIVKTEFCGTRENSAGKGSITEIGINNFTPGNLILGTLEGMTQELYNMYRTISEAADIPITETVLSGNGIRRNPILKKIIEEKFNMPQSLADYEEEAACGAAISTKIYEK